jgi:thermostable 8-oxoguanine DNA glycosylase
MIDPENIVKSYTDEELEELIFFCILVAGKTAKTVARQVNSIKIEAANYLETLFEFIQNRKNPIAFTEVTLKKYGIGCHTVKSKALVDVVTKYKSGKELRNASVQDLEKVYGIGPKTARFFIMCHKGGNYAALDTHILKFLKSQGLDVPKSTPSGKKYLELELEFLKLVPPNMTPAEFDLEIWKQYAKG